jgi:hypothetical protein
VFLVGTGHIVALGEQQRGRSFGSSASERLRDRGGIRFESYFGCDPMYGIRRNLGIMNHFQPKVEVGGAFYPYVISCCWI